MPAFLCFFKKVSKIEKRLLNLGNGKEIKFLRSKIVKFLIYSVHFKYWEFWIKIDIAEMFLKWNK